MKIKWSIRYYLRCLGVLNRHEKLVKKIYEEIFFRDAEDDAIEHYGLLLKKGSITEKKLREILLHSKERKILHSLEQKLELELEPSHIPSESSKINKIEPSNESKRMIHTIYQDIFLRPPDKSELEHYTSLLKTKKRKSDEIRKIMLKHSDGKNLLKTDEIKKIDELGEESKRIITQLYKEIFLRPPDKVGLEYYASLLESKKKSANEIRELMINSFENKYLLKREELKRTDDLSNESKKIITQLYQENLLRPPDKSGLEHYASLLESKKRSPEEIRKFLLNSFENEYLLKRDELKREEELGDESKRIITQLYEEIFLRPPDKAGLEYYASLLESKKRNAEEIRKFLLKHPSSKHLLKTDEIKKIDELGEESKRIITQLYQETIFRHPDKAGLEYYASLLESKKKSANEIRELMINSFENKYLLKREELKKFDDLSDETKNILNNWYQKYLYRKPDRDGAELYGSMLECDRITSDFIKNIFLEMEETKEVLSYTDYSVKYWNDLPNVKKYKDKLATDNENLDWQVDIPNRFEDYVPFKRVLIVGCGNGWLERKLFDLNIGLHFDAFDISEEYLEEAKDKRGNRKINYFVDDINKLENVQHEYDAIFNYAILHHAKKIEFMFDKLSRILSPKGLMFNEEYTGPSKNQYSDEHVKIMTEINNKLPKRFRQTRPLRPFLSEFRVEPSEAVHSALVKQLFEKYFDVIFERNLNGGIAYQILWNNIKQFEDGSDSAAKWLDYLLKEDYNLSKNGKVPILFWYGVGKPKILQKN